MAYVSARRRPGNAVRKEVVETDLAVVPRVFRALQIHGLVETHRLHLLEGGERFDWLDIVSGGSIAIPGSF